MAGRASLRFRPDRGAGRNASPERPGFSCSWRDPEVWPTPRRARHRPLTNGGGENACRSHKKTGRRAQKPPTR